MRLKIKFGQNSEPFTKPTIDYVVGYIHKCLGDNNKWHNRSSNYSVSQMRGGRLDKNGFIQYPYGGHIIVSSDDRDFISTLSDNIRNGTVQTMKFEDYATYKQSSMPNFDMVRINCLRLKVNDKNITFEDEQNFIDILRSHTIKKLIKSGVSESDAETIIIEPFHKENWTTKWCKVKVGTKQENCIKTSCIQIILKGNRSVREKLTSIGFGQSTGYGFGFAGLKCDYE